MCLLGQLLCAFLQCLPAATPLSPSLPQALHPGTVYRFRAEMFRCGRAGLGSALSSRKPSLSSSCRMAKLASCSMSLKVSPMLRNIEKKSSWSRVSTRMLSGKSSVAFFSSRVTSTHCTTRLTGHRRNRVPPGQMGTRAGQGGLLPFACTRNPQEELHPQHALRLSPAVLGRAHHDQQQAAEVSAMAQANPALALRIDWVPICPMNSSRDINEHV